MPRQTLATTTDTTASVGSDRKASGSIPTEPSTELTSPYSASLSSTCQRIPTSTPGMIHAHSTTVRTTTAPGSPRATARCTISAMPRPSSSCPTIEAPTKIAVTERTRSSDGSPSVVA